MDAVQKEEVRCKQIGNMRSLKKQRTGGVVAPLDELEVEVPPLDVAKQPLLWGGEVGTEARDVALRASGQ